MRSESMKMSFLRWYWLYGMCSIVSICGVNSLSFSPPSVSVFFEMGNDLKEVNNKFQSTVFVEDGWTVYLNCTSNYPHFWTSNIIGKKIVSPPRRQVGQISDTSSFVYTSEIKFKIQSVSSVSCGAIAQSTLKTTHHFKPKGSFAGIDGNSDGHNQSLGMEEWSQNILKLERGSLTIWETEPIATCESKESALLTIFSFHCMFVNACQLDLACLNVVCPKLYRQTRSCPKPCKYEAMELHHHQGVVGCLKNRLSPTTQDIADNLLAISFRFTGLDDRQYTSAGKIPDKAVVAIKGPFSQVLHTNQLHVFSCHGSYAVVGEEIQWIYTNKEGSEIWIQKGSYIDASNTEATKEPEPLPSIQSSISINVTLEMTKISCLVPYQNSLKFARASTDITVRDVAPPSIQGSNFSTFSLSTGNHPFHLFCNASGEPTPDFDWKFNDKFITQNDSKFRITTKGPHSMLTLSTTDPELSGQIVCTAKNGYGSDSVTFGVSVSDRYSKSTIVSLISLIGILVLLSASAVCYAIHWRGKHHLTTKMENMAILNFTQKFPVLTRSQIEGFEPHENFPEIREDEFTIDQNRSLPIIVGTGRFRVAYKVTLRGQVCVAESPRVRAGRNICEASLHQIQVCSEIRGGHPHVIQLKGAFTSLASYGIIYMFSEYSEVGSLKEYLVTGFLAGRFVDIRELHKPTPNMNLDNPRVFTTLDLLRFGAQIAGGMAFLTDQKIVHGNLTTDNILLFDGKNICPKITEFELEHFA